MAHIRMKNYNISSTYLYNFGKERNSWYKIFGNGSLTKYSDHFRIVRNNPPTPETYPFFTDDYLLSKVIKYKYIIIKYKKIDSSGVLSVKAYDRNKSYSSYYDITIVKNTTEISQDGYLVQTSEIDKEKIVTILPYIVDKYLCLGVGGNYGTLDIYEVVLTNYK